MICVKGTFSSQESGKEMQRATRLESVHHTHETEIMHDYYSIMHDPASSILEKRTLQGHKLRHPQVLIWTDGRKQLGCSSTCESTIETFSQSSQECTPIPFASSVSASRTPWKEHRARGLQMSTALIALVKMPP